MSNVRKNVSVVKARSASKMARSNSKVSFTPTESSTKRMAKASHEGHIGSSNNIMRFENIR